MIIDVDRVFLEEVTVRYTGILHITEQASSVHTINCHITIKCAILDCAAGKPPGKSAAVSLVIAAKDIEAHGILTDFPAYHTVRECGIPHTSGQCTAEHVPCIHINACEDEMLHPGVFKLCKKTTGSLNGRADSQSGNAMALSVETSVK